MPDGTNLDRTYGARRAWLLLASIFLQGGVAMAAVPQPHFDQTDIQARLESLRSRLRTQADTWPEPVRACEPDLAVRLWAIGEGLRDAALTADLHDKMLAGLRETEQMLDACDEGRDPLAGLRGMVVRGVAIPGQDHPMPYGAQIPSAYDPATSWPLFVYVHGGSASEQARFAISRFGGAAPTTRPSAPASRPIDQMLKIWVPRHGGSWAEPQNEQRVFAALADMKAHYSVAADRIYIQGFSLGGFGAVHFAVRHPDLWAGAGPSGPTPIGAYMPMAENVMNLPMFLCHGSVDDVCDVRNSRQLFERLRDLRFDAVYREDARVAHRSTDLARAAQEAWLLTKTRNRWPERVIYLTDDPRYHRAYWLDIVQLAPSDDKTPARIEALRTAPGQFQVTTRGIQSFSILLDEQIAARGKPVTVSINGNPAQEYPWPREDRLTLDVPTPGQP